MYIYKLLKKLFGIKDPVVAEVEVKVKPKRKKKEVNLEKMTKQELVDFASKKKLQLKMSLKKSDMIQALKDKV